MNGGASSSNPRRPVAPATPAAATQLAPGFRFHPTDDELVSYYLKRKVSGKSLRIDAIAEIDLYKCEPWDLPPLSRIVSRDLEWYFFSPLDRKYSNRSRMNRSTAQGYWKTTGKDRPIRHNHRVVGMKKTLVYHAGRAPRGERTNWVMHEYRLEDQELAGTVTCTGIPQDAYVVCRIFKKSGQGPQNGAQYGAPFNEEEWEETDGGMIMLRDDGDDDFFDAGEQEQEYLQMNDFLQDSGSHQEDPSVLLEEILNDPSFGNDMVEHTDERGLQNGPALGNDMGQNIGMADSSYTAGQNEGYVELNDLADTVNAEDPPSEDSVGCSSWTCNDWKPVDGVDDIINFQEILDVDEFFDTVNEDINQPELFQMSPPLSDNYDMQPIDIRNFLAGDCPSGQLAEGNTMFYDADSNDLAFAQDNFAELNHLLDLPISDPSRFDMVDNLMAYFDAMDDNLHVDTAGFLENSGCMNSSILDQFNLTPEFDGINAQPNEVIPWASEANVASGPSSSLRLPDADNQLKTENDVNIKLDVKRSESNGKTITKRLVNMLGSISAPPAIAAEYPVRSEKPVGQISETHSASSIHFTAGMIQIRGLTVTGSTEHWSLQKNGDVDFLLSYGMDGDEARKSIGFEPISKIQGGLASVVLRGGFYLFFLSALILTVSYGVGLCICSR
ncbi:NAC domain-containing protein 53 isoform X2 [Elaeis guineensis]|uniref:NAC domain-containing protein 78 isoform X2 n=1 Tax=Elaeis guineensis var. tenera TaxID=51953 RepID=A0A6I9S9S1_ELAGV|nr:NAC domain-containing protein 78 isoform X2 [Elaeis guineensis]